MLGRLGVVVLASATSVRGGAKSLDATWTSRRFSPQNSVIQPVPDGKPVAVLVPIELTFTSEK